jgi:hypothetical protein
MSNPLTVDWTAGPHLHLGVPKMDEKRHIADRAPHAIGKIV